MTHFPLLADVDPERDLVLERVLAAPIDAVWSCWTQAERLTPWFCPRPWRVVRAELALRPGGVFRFDMRGPAGEAHDNVGCFLVVEPQRRLVWTDAMGPDFRPKASSFMTADISFLPRGNETLYRAVARHSDASVRDQHAAMGFSDGWGTCCDQLVAFVNGTLPP